MSSQIKAVLRREGDYWTIVYGGSVVHLKDTKGLHYLEQLLRHPSRTFDVIDLLEVAGRRHRNAHAVARDDARSVERARKAVTNRIRQTVARIRSIHETLGLHLSNAVHTGVRCSYTPDQPAKWTR